MPRNMKPIKKSIGITVDKDVLERARSESEKCKRSLSQFVNVILKHYLGSKDKSKLFEEEN